MSLGDIRTQKNLAGTTADEIDQFIRTIGQPNVDPFSSGADATRPVDTTDRYSSAADAIGGAGIDLSSAGQAYYDSLIEQGMSPIEAEQQVKVLAGYGYKDGGLTTTVPPKEGPMSAGVASLFKNK